jgi:hypothetical protein
MKAQTRKKLVKRLPCYSCIVYAMCKEKYKDKLTIFCQLLSDWICKFDMGDMTGWKIIKELYPHLHAIQGKK